MNVLLAEADTELAGSYCRFLGRHGFEVTTAGDGVDCLRLLRHWFPSVLALDLDLLWGGAEGVLGHLREQHSHRRPPAVILIGQIPEERLPADFLRSPVVKYLCKPFGLGDLLESIRGCMPGEDAERGNTNRAGPNGGPATDE